MEARNFLLKHSQELSEKYPGKYLAIIDNEVIAVSDSGIEVFRRAKEKYPKKYVHVSYMPTDEEMVTLL